MKPTWKIVLFSGSRNWTDMPSVMSTIEEVFLRYLTDLLLLQGGAAGLDYIVREYALGRGLPCITMNAAWDAHGRAAGPIRNNWMTRFRPVESHLFYSDLHKKSRGTWHMEQTLQKERLSYAVYGPDGFEEISTPLENMLARE